VQLGMDELKLFERQCMSSCCCLPYHSHYSLSLCY